MSVTALGQVSLLVRDTDRAVAFYRDVLGLPHLFTFGALAFLDVAGVRLYLQTCSAEDWRPGSVLYFAVEDIAAAYAALEEQGVTTVRAPQVIHTHESTGAQEWMAFFEDTEGNTLALLARVPVAST